MGERLRTLQARFGLRPTPLVFGIAFLALGVAGLGGGADGETAWLWVVLLTAAGIAGLTAAVRAMARPSTDSS